MTRPLISVNAVERVLWYSDTSTLPQEAPHELPATRPVDTWPGQGVVKFDNVVMSYRNGLPAVLKGM